MSRCAYKSQPEGERLSKLIDSLQARGLYTLTRAQAREELGISNEALKKAAQRLVAKRRIAIPRRDFFVIVPVEYRDAGAPPPSWYIDDLMGFLGQPYYVGLLSAAALHGAAHQQPQEFQVVTKKQLREMAIGLARIRYFRKLHLERTPTQDLQTETGAMRVSTPEATALDLLRYVRRTGHLNHVATVLVELAERMDGNRLVQTAIEERDLPAAQRLGYMLEQIGIAGLTDAMAVWISDRRPRYVPLRADRPAQRAPRVPRWRVLANEKVEAVT